MRRFRGVVLLLALAAADARQPVDRHDDVVHGTAVSTTARVVDRYSVAWAHPPTAGTPHPVPVGRPSPPTGPYAGNGDVSLLYSGNGTAGSRRAEATMDWQQWLYLSKNDMWGSDKQSYYPHLSAGRIGILLTPSDSGAASVNASVEMYPGNSTLMSTLIGSAGTVTASTRVLENNAVVTTLVCTSKSGAACPVELLLSDTDGNHYGVSQDAGAAPDNKLVSPADPQSSARFGKLMQR